MSDTESKTTEQITKEEKLAKLLSEKADDLLASLEVAIKCVFPDGELRRVMWIAVYERVRARIDACK